MSEVFNIVDIVGVFGLGLGLGLGLGTLAYVISALFETVKRLTS